MSIARLKRLASQHGRLTVAALLAACGIAAAPALAAAEPSVTEVAVRFRDAASATDFASSPTTAQFDAIGRSLRTGIATWSATVDGGFRIVLAPSLPFTAAREAVNRLRMNADVLYASIVTTDAPVAPRPMAEKRDRPEPPLHRIIVRYRDPQAAADAAADRPLDSGRLDAIAAIAGQPVAHERAMAWAHAYLVRLFVPLPREQVEAIAQALARQPDVLWAQPDYLDEIHLTPNDTLYPNQWHYFEVAGGANLPNAWDRTTGWSGVRVAVTDTGALFGHPDLGSRFLGGYDFVITASVVDPRDGDNRDPNAADEGDWVSLANECGPGSSPSNSSWHGTHVAGTIGAVSNNASGVAGVNWIGRIVPVRVLAKCGGFTSDIADGLVWASGGAVTGVPANPHPARVVNMSLGGRRANQQCDPAYQTGVNTANANNAVVVVSAGNGNEDSSFSTPANCNGVVTVASVGRTGQRATYSNFDNNDASGVQVEIAAPGGSFADGQNGVLSTLNNGLTTPGVHSFVEYQGTSMAAPHVAGVVSLMLSLKPSLTPAQALSILTSTARAFPTGTVRDCTSNLGSVTGTIKYCGAGIVNADAALDNIMTTGGPGGTPMTASTATLGSSLNPSAAGAPVTFTSNVTGTFPAPPGTVAFMDGESVIASCGAVALVGAGSPRTAQCVTSALSQGTHSIRAVFSGNTVDTPADSPLLAQVVNPGAPQPTTTSVASSQNPAAQGASITFTATVTGFNPTGTVLFQSNAVTIAGCAAVALSGGGSSPTAQCTTTTIAVGNNTIDAIYSGDAFNLTSSGSLTQGIVGPTACAIFNDVPNTDPFCPNVQWIANRLITLGCDPTNYCPGNPVSRIAMAAFMNREGVALTPIDLAVAFGDFGVNLATPQILCATADFQVTSFPRRAFMRARANVYSPTANVDVAVELVYSTNSGGSWTAVPGSMMFQTLYAGGVPDDDKTVVPFGALDLAVGTTYRFAMRFSRAAGTGNPNVYCANAVQIANRNASSPPF